MSRVSFSLNKLLVVAALFALLIAACGPLSAGSGQPAESPATARTGQSDLRVEVVGLLEDLTADNATIGGIRLKITQNTLLEGDLAPNQVVEAQSVLGDDGLAAVAIQQAEPTRAAGQTFELTGVVESQIGPVWVIGGHSVQVHPTLTELVGSPAVGTLVAVQGSTNQSGALLARAIQTAGAAATTGAEIEFTGSVTSIGADEWVIGGRTVRVTLQTEIKAGVALGAFVKVHAGPASDGVLVAREIELAAAATGTPRPDDDDDDERPGEQEFTGELTAINGDLWTIGGQAVRITTATELKGTLQIGDRLKVHASPGADGVLVAREVELAEGDDDDGGRAGEQEFTGTLTAINGDLWTIGGRQVRIVSSTEVKGSLQVGDLVKVHATPGTDGILVAREVEPANGNDDDDHSGSGNGDDDDRNDDNSGPGNSDDDDRDDDNSGPGNGDDDGDNDDNSGPGNGNDDDDDDDNSGSGGGDDDDDDDNSGSGGGDDD